MGNFFFKSNKIYYTKEEIKKHNNNKSFWLVCNTKVYDITTFINKHPGGSEILLKKTNIDCSKDYNFHSKNAKKIWKKYLIGYVKEN